MASGPIITPLLLLLAIASGKESLGGVYRLLVMYVSQLTSRNPDKTKLRELETEIREKERGIDKILAKLEIHLHPVLHQRVKRLCTLANTSPPPREPEQDAPDLPEEVEEESLRQFQA